LEEKIKCNNFGSKGGFSMSLRRKSLIVSPLQGNTPPAYQVQHTAGSYGKTLSATKRRVRFRFGFADLKALSNKNLRGAQCCGEEHEVIFVWSIASGKRLVLCDGHEVHFSATHSLLSFKSPWLLDRTFDHSWIISGNHSFRLIAHATPFSGFSATESVSVPFRQFDLLVNGQSFFDMAHVFELGFSERGGGLFPPRIRKTFSLRPNNLMPQETNCETVEQEHDFQIERYRWASWRQDSVSHSAPTDLDLIKSTPRCSSLSQREDNCLFDDSLASSPPRETKVTTLINYSSPGEESKTSLGTEDTVSTVSMSERSPGWQISKLAQESRQSLATKSINRLCHEKKVKRPTFGKQNQITEFERLKAPRIRLC